MRVRFDSQLVTIIPSRVPQLEYAFESASAQSHLSSPSSSFDSTLETLHEDSELEFDPMDRIKNDDEPLCVLPIRRPSDRKPLSATHNRRDEEKKDKKAKD